MMKIAKKLGLVRAEIRNGELKASCPFAEEKHLSGTDNSPSFSINLDRGVYNCFSCGSRGTIEDLFSKVLDISISDAIDVLLGLGYNRLEQVVRKVIVRNQGVDEIIIPEGVLEEFSLIDPEEEKYLGIIDGRKCNIYPVRNSSGNLVGGLARSVEGRFHKNLWRFSKKEYLFGEHKIIRSMPIVVVEGPGDYFALKQSSVINPVAMMGAFMSNEQADKIVSWTNRLIVWLDADTAGFEGTKRIKKMLDARIHVRYVDILNVPANDPREVYEKFGSDVLCGIIDSSLTWLELSTYSVLK